MVKLIGKIRPSGNSYIIRIKKALIESEVLEPYKEYEFVLVEKENPLLWSLSRNLDDNSNYEMVL